MSMLEKGLADSSVTATAGTDAFEQRATGAIAAKRKKAPAREDWNVLAQDLPNDLPIASAEVDIVYRYCKDLIETIMRCENEEEAQ